MMTTMVRFLQNASPQWANREYCHFCKKKVAAGGDLQSQHRHHKISKPFILGRCGCGCKTEFSIAAPQSYKKGGVVYYRRRNRYLKRYALGHESRWRPAAAAK